MAVVAGPNSPKGADEKDKSKRPGLDAPPPPPPGNRTVDMSTLAGQPNAGPAGGTPPTGDMAGMVVQRAAMLDQQIQQLAQMMPQFVPIAAQMSAMLKQGIVQSLQAAQGGGGPAGAGGAAPPGAAGGGMVPPPGGPPGGGAPMPMAGLAG